MFFRLVSKQVSPEITDIGAHGGIFLETEASPLSGSPFQDQFPLHISQGTESEPTSASYVCGFCFYQYSFSYYLMARYGYNNPHRNLFFQIW